MLNTKNQKFKETKINIVFLIYFVIMLCFYTITYVQLLGQVFLIIYVIGVQSKRKLIYKKNHIISILMYTGWFGALTFWAFISNQWAYGVLPSSKTMITLFRIFVMGFIIVLYIDSSQKLYEVLKAFIYACFIMGVIVLISTPISEYGKSGENGFGVRAVEQHRNDIGAMSTFMILICYFFYREEDFKFGKFLMIFFTILLLCTGSRSSILQLIILLFIYFIDTKDFYKKINAMFILIIFAIIGFLLITAVPFLRDTFFTRFLNMITVFSGQNNLADKSTLGRILMIQLAFKMFLSRPILGYGVDGFRIYLDQHNSINGYIFTIAFYSHCNFAELAADFGIVGLIIWYWMIFYIIIKSLKYKDKDIYIKLVFSIIISMVCLDIARINWSDHLLSYLHILTFCILRIRLEELKYKDYKLDTKNN